ncbi:MAG: rhomboid family intramembrane serine protease [Chloroflexi bacterium]|nr:rhomboid family intramembrane serine protease [Chloroflexota bacterium]
MGNRYYRPSYNVIWGLIGITVFFFLIDIILPPGRGVALFGLREVTLGARPWTIVTSIFMHGGIWHIFVNMLTLYFFGSALLGLVGNVKFLIVYFGGGLLGNILFLLLSHPLATVVGASGALFALGGALAVMRPKLSVFIFPIPVPVPLWIAVIGGFLLMSFLPGIAWQAHLGGLIFGLVAGYFFRRQEQRPRPWGQASSISGKFWRGRRL